MSQTTKVYEFAKEIGMETLALMDKIKAWKLPVKSHMATLDEQLVEEIMTRLSEEKSSAKSTKKAKTKKKAATKKNSAEKKVATTKKTATKKKTAKKVVTKKVAKKVVTKKTVTKKVSVKKAVEEEESVAKKSTTVIRRRAADKEQAAAEAQAKLEADAAAAEIELVEASEQTLEGSSDLSASSESPTSSVEEAAPKKRVLGRSIVGKIDLAKTNKPRVTSDSSASAAPRRPSAQRGNIRTGFVAPPAPDLVFQEEARKREERAPKKKAGTTAEKAKEQTTKSFTQADFRKREVIFQPKKKKTVMRGDLKKTEITTPKASKRIVKMHESISVADLADQMKLKAPQLIKVLVKNGVMANMNMNLDFETVSLITPEFGFEAQTLYKTEVELIQDVAFGDLESERITRPPVVTVMGHVDHGKTTLLDSIRKADVVSGEAGGITQHIGAYSVKTDLGEVTFIDTPGHAAFTAMRARGANCTDIAIIVVAADDGLMPQTEEAINHAKAAGVPIIVAVNKMDKPGANPEKVKQQLTEFELIPEDWGGSTIYCEVSALNGTGIPELLEQIVLVAEVAELKANPKRSATGVVIEAKIEKGKGAVATLLIQDGTVRVGDIVAAGKVVGKIRAMSDHKGVRTNEVGPGRPVEIMGLSEAPLAGDQFDVCKDDAAAEKLAGFRIQQEGLVETPNSGMSLDQIFAKAKAGNLSELPIVLKADVAGSIEAIKASLVKLGNDEVKVKVIHSAVGGITESDVLLATTSGGLIIGFNVRPDTNSQKLAKEKSIEIKCYKIIYELLDDIKSAMSGMLAPDLIEKAMGQAEVRETFSVPKIGVIAGCFVIDGKVNRGSKVRLVREGRVIYEGVMNSLKRFKDDAKEVATGYECGIGIENYNDIKVGDIIEAFMVEEVARSLD